jgi:hypothetical protein
MILGDEAANEGRTRCPAVRRRYLLARCVMQNRANDQVSGRNSIVATQLPTYNDWSRNVTRSLVRAGNLFRHSSTTFWKLLSPDTYLYTYLPDRKQSCLELAYPLNGLLCWVVMHSPLQLEAVLPHELVLKRRTVLKSMHLTSMYWRSDSTGDRTVRKRYYIFAGQYR